ncbi:MAG: PAS domain S-box protein [Bacteroidetes bacterium]|nr:PAS domain S-box protein [Bacteroidota bacterium]
MFTLFLAAATVGMALYISTDKSQKIDSSFQRLSHTYEVLLHAEKLLSALTEKEALTREYMLSGNKDYLNLLKETRLSVEDEFAKLKGNILDNPSQQKRIDSLDQLLKLRSAFYDSLIILYSSNKAIEPSDRGLASDVINTHKRTTKQLILKIETEEQKILKYNKSENISAISNLQTVLYIGIVLLIVLFMILFQKLRVEVIADRKTFDMMQYNTTLMNNVEGAIVSTDKNFLIVSWNKQAEIIFGWTEQEMKGRTFASILRPSYKGIPPSTVAKEILKNGAWSGEVTMEKKKGDIITVYISVTLIKSGDGKMTGTVSIARDITARKQTEEQLKLFNEELGKQVEEHRSELNYVVQQLVLSEKKYKLLFEGNPLPMLMVTLPDLGITDVNEAAERQYGFPKQLFISKTMYDLLAPDDMNGNNVLKDKSLGYQYGGYGKHQKGDGTLINVEMFTHGMLFDGKVTKLILVQDITEKVETDNKLKEYLEEIRMLTSHLQEIREEERKNIAREIHDELGQQLTVIKMEIAWAIRKLKQPEKQKVKLEGLLETIDSTMRSVRRICSELRPTLLDDLGLVAALQWHAGQLRSSTGIKIYIDAPEEIDNLPADIKTGMYRIFQESLTNIMRHAEAKKVEIQLIVENKMIILHIKDDGKGFDILASSKKKTLGILGMKERSLNMGGEYIIGSYPGKGTSVMVSIPLNTKTENITFKTITDDKDPYRR